jgi:hypothetical protein
MNNIILTFQEYVLWSMYYIMQKCIQIYGKILLLAAWQMIRHDKVDDVDILWQLLIVMFSDFNQDAGCC